MFKDVCPLKEHKRSVWALLCAALVLALWCLGLFFAQRAGVLLAPLSVRWEGEDAGVSPAEFIRAERYAQEDGTADWPEAVLWREAAGQSVDDPEGDAASAADVLEGFGSLDLLYPASFLHGGYPARGDTEGCAIDRALAFRLWGSADAVGRSLRWNGRIYTVRGIFQGDAGLFLAQAEEDSEARLDRLLLRFPGEAGADEATALLNRCGFPSGTVLDQPMLGWCLSALAAVPGLLLAAVLLARLLGRGWRLRHMPVLLCQYLPLALAGGAAVLWAAGLAWTMPDRLVPTRWADFAFWQRTWGQAAEGVRQALSAGLGRRDSAMWSAALGCVLAAVPAAVLVLPAAGRVEARSAWVLLWRAILAMGLVLAATAALAPQGGLEAGRALWLLPTLWLAGDLALRAHEESLRPRPQAIETPKAEENAQ